MYSKPSSYLINKYNKFSLFMSTNNKFYTIHDPNYRIVVIDEDFNISFRN